jgi:hypothetical protein
VRRHNRLVREEYEDLRTWVHDDRQKEADALEEVRRELAARGMLQSGELAHRLLEVRNEFARRWRDRKRAFDRRIAELREGEGLTVKIWRKLSRSPWPEDPESAELHQLTQAWEDENIRNGAVYHEVESRRGPS